jgi:hypothetical protein
MYVGSISALLATAMLLRVCVQRANADTLHTTNPKETTYTHSCAVLVCLEATTLLLCFTHTACTYTHHSHVATATLLPFLQDGCYLCAKFSLASQALTRRTAQQQCCCSSFCYCHCCYCCYCCSHQSSTPSTLLQLIEVSPHLQSRLHQQQQPPVTVQQFARMIPVAAIVSALRSSTH